MEKSPLARTCVKLFWLLNKGIIIKVLLLLFVGRDGLSGRDGVKVSTRKNVRYKLPARNSGNQVTSTSIRRWDTQIHLTLPLLIFLPSIHRKLSGFLHIPARADLFISTCVVFSQGDKGNQGRDGKKGEPGTCDIKVCKRIYITVISQLADHKRLKEMY